VTVADVVSEVEASGGAFRLDGEKVMIRFTEPEYREKLAGHVAFLRARRDEVAELLRQRAHESGENWPQASREMVRRFGQPHAHLFPFIGRKVRTPDGPGTLMQVFAERVTVLLDSELSKCAAFRLEEIEPLSWELA
jgi:hypothetical protein